MSERYGDIRSLETVITTEARQDASKITAETASHIASIKRQALQQANQQRDAIVKQAREKVETLRSQAITSAQLDELVLKLSRILKITFVIVTHELPSIYAVADRVVMLDKESKGIIATGKPQELRQQSDHPLVRQFFNRQTQTPAAARENDG